jgi:hypothetical protein
VGRTLPTQIQLLQGEEESWKGFRRALRSEDREAFDLVWSYARRHATATSMAARPLPFEAYCLSMIVGLQRDLSELKKKLEARRGGGNLEPS